MKMKPHRNDDRLSLCLLIAAIVMIVISLVFWSSALFPYLVAAGLAVALFFAFVPIDPAEGPLFRFTLKWLFQKHGYLEYYRALILIGYGVMFIIGTLVLVLGGRMTLEKTIVIGDLPALWIL